MNTRSLHPFSISIWMLSSLMAGLLLLSSGCAGPSVGEQQLKAQRKFEEAQNMSPKEKQKKIKKLKEAILMAPKEPMYRVALGNVYFRELKLNKAERLYLSAIKVDPEYMGTYRQLGRLYMQKNDWDNAVYYLNRALTESNVIAPVQLYNWLAYCHYRKGSLAKAEKAWLKALDIHESDQIRLNLALAYKQGDQIKLAKASLLKALELNPKLMGAHFALGEIYYRSNKFAQAKKHFNRVIHLEPFSEQAKVSKKILKQLIPKK